MISLKSSKLPKNEVFPVEESLSKKRKWDDPTEEISQKLDKIKSLKPPDFDTNFQNETPFPLEWQRCLDIKSGEIYFYNTRTQKRALHDPRSTSPEPPKSNPAPMSLELQLNLPCQSLHKNHDSDKISPYSTNQPNNSSKQSKDSDALTRSPSWLTFEEDEQEMVTAVCKKCYMLVMMNKSSPACPNCKFVHPSDSEPGPNLFNQRLSLLC